MNGSEKVRKSFLHALEFVGLLTLEDNISLITEIQIRSDGAVKLKFKEYNDKIAKDETPWCHGLNE